MSDTIKFKCCVNTTNSAAPLSLEIKLDGQSMAEISPVTAETEVVFDIPDNETNHRIEFIMTGKTQAHTKVDQDGNIVSDALLTISELTIDDISLQAWLHNIVHYNHDFNGSQEPLTDKFYGNMGCNGIATMEFTTPFYLWLLENL